MNFKILFLIAFWAATHFAWSQPNRIENLSKKVTSYNDALAFEKSILLLSDFISDKKLSPYERYQAYLLKSHTYKRLFNYQEALFNLDMALKEGRKSHHKKEVENNIMAEKAFILFDTNKYGQASKLMDELDKVNYQYLSFDNQVFIIMQEGYLLMLEQKYSEAENKLDLSLHIAQQYCPRNLPNIYGKKIELYNKMKRYAARDESFAKGIELAKKYRIIKYEMYLYEVLTHQYKNNQDYKNAFFTQLKFDSISNIYNVSNNNGKVELIEKQIELQRFALDKKMQQQKTLYLIGLIGILAILLIISVQLFVTNREKRMLVEKENTRVHHEIELLTKAKDDKGNTKINLDHFNLTPRQYEITQLIQQGKSNKEIAALLFISENTVKYHLKQIYEILDIEHRVELTARGSS